MNSCSVLSVFNEIVIDYRYTMIASAPKSRTVRVETRARDHLRTSLLKHISSCTFHLALWVIEGLAKRMGAGAAQMAR